ncbi:hypothetical protein BB559_002696, partial [Furculomyces boomerangus]
KTKPSIGYGLRGINYFSIDVSGPVADLHSGVFGGVVQEPMVVLTKLLAGLVEVDGKINIPGIHDRVMELTEVEEKTYHGLALTTEGLITSFGGDYLMQKDIVQSLMHRGRYPSLSVHGIEGAFYDPGSKTVIPASVKGKFSIRTVPNMDLEEVKNITIDHVHKEFAKLNSKCKLEVRELNNGKWWYASPNLPINVAAARAMKRVYGTEPEYVRGGGSVPITIVFQEHLKADILLLPMGTYGDGAHSTNEKLDKYNFTEGIKNYFAFLYEEFQPHFEEKTINYATEEALYYSDIFTGSLVPGAVDCTYIGDDCIPEELLDELKENVAELEDVPEHEKDWDPGSNNQVLDLLHPSLYPVVFGRTRGITDDVSSTEVPKWDSVIGKGETKSVIPPEEDNEYLSEKYQWLPAQFDVDANGKVRILSYINNLHPKIHEKMYGTLEKIFEKISSDDYYNEEFEDYFNRLRKGEAEKNGTEFVRGLNKEDVDKEDLDDYCGTYGDEKLILVCKYRKLANIVLTHENPKYKGGVWHVEGMENKEIVTTGMYYYDQENITDSYLAFRQCVCEEEYTSYDFDTLKSVFNLKNQEPLNQRLGEIKTVKNRMISFPNIYQHQVQDFVLQDKTKPGYRKILCFFLINPNKRIYSTAHIPPQQLSWFEIELMKNKNKLSELPGLITDEISKTLDWPISLEETKKHREELMEERKFYVEKENEEIFERPFSLCEL